MDRRALLLDEGLDAGVQLLHAALDGHGEERQDLVKLRQVRRVQVARPRRAELERTDHAVLVEQGRHDDVAESELQELVVRRRPVGHFGQVLDDQRAPLDHRALVDGPAKLLDGVVPGVGEDARVLALGAVVEDEHLVAVEGGEAEAQLRPPEEGPQLVLQRPEARVGDDRLLVDQVALEEDSTSWSVTSMALKIVNPRKTNRSAARPRGGGWDPGDRAAGAAGRRRSASARHRPSRPRRTASRTPS